MGTTTAGSGLDDAVERIWGPLVAHHTGASRAVLEAVCATAAGAHRGQRRATGDPYVTHPLQVAQLCAEWGLPPMVVHAAVLHDVIEDTDVDYEEIEQRFGRQVADLVAAVSEPAGGGGYPERKERLRAAVAAGSLEAAAVYAADKVCKARELRIALVARGGPADPEKSAHYWASLEMLERRLGQHPLVRQLRFELEALTLLPPAE